MRRIRLLVGLAALALVALFLSATTAIAANSGTFRDCSFPAGLDPDFVQLSGAAESPPGTLTVPQSQQQVQLLASESADSGDSSGADTFTATVSAPNVRAQTVSGTGTGKVLLAIPLGGAAPGTSYTISWSATFDNGMHQCPSPLTPQNIADSPFVLAVSADPPVLATGPAAPVAPSAPISPSSPPIVKRSARAKCHRAVRRSHGHTRRLHVCRKARKHRRKDPSRR